MSRLASRDFGTLGASTTGQVDQAELMALAQANLLQQAGDLTRPVWVPFLSTTIRSAGTNADTTYGVALIDPAGTYRISGRPGTVVFADLLVGAGVLGIVDGHRPNVGVIDFTDLKVGDQQYFEILLSAERPAGYDGHWFRLTPEADHLWLRQYSYDWASERPWTVGIERLDVDFGATTAAHPDIDVAGYVKRYMATWTNHVNGMVDRGCVNSLEVVGLPDTTGMVAQSYFQGVFELTEDHALVLEVTPPRQCRYWSVQLTDDRYIALDWVWRQTSLNGHQAELDEDGVFRAVISQRDPGVANWLDTSGRGRGTILGRWNRADSNPVPSLALVPFDELGRHLPAGRSQVSPEDRAARLRARAAAAQARS